jgi:hypothetical protein
MPLNQAEGWKQRMEGMTASDINLYAHISSISASTIISDFSTKRNARHNRDKQNTPFIVFLEGNVKETKR